MLNIVIFGPPGAGKGAQSQNIINKYHLVHLSTGDILRSQIALGTPLGIKAKKLMDKGELVPDDIVIGMINYKIENSPDAKGFIFDGFPRTVAQAEALDKLLKDKKTFVSGVISLEVQYNELVKRILNRGKDSGRSDDQDIAIIQNRIMVYNDKTSPLINFYKAQNKYHAINGMGSIEEIFRRITKVMDAF
ncbi:MAG: adenylate kinase [Bacteroidia bacterium]|nr:adenylate kinase [Bacteroidia bacterium]